MSIISNIETTSQLLRIVAMSLQLAIAIIVVGFMTTVNAIAGSTESDCIEAQFIVENLPDSLEDLTDIISYKEAKLFKSARPSVNNGRIMSYAFEDARYDDQISCKFLSQETIQQSIGVRPLGHPLTCGTMNQIILDRVISHSRFEMVDKYRDSGISIQFEPDQNFYRKDSWQNAQIKTEKQFPNIIRIHSPSFRTLDWLGITGGERYCKILSERGAKNMINDAISWGQRIRRKLNPVDFIQVNIKSQEVDIYFPSRSITSMPIAILIQGAKVHKKYYSKFATYLARLGYVVAVPNNNNLLGKSMPGQHMFNQTYDYLVQANSQSQSPLFNLIDIEKAAVIGHSLGGVASTRILGDQCMLPTCIGQYNSPEALRLGVIIGTNSKTPIIGGFSTIETGNRPLMFIQGDQDGIALVDDGLITFKHYSNNQQNVFVKVIGGNHYSVTDVIQPKEARLEKYVETINHERALQIIVNWTDKFLRAHLQQDDQAYNEIYRENKDQKDPNILIMVKDQAYEDKKTSRHAL